VAGGVIRETPRLAVERLTFGYPGGIVGRDVSWALSGGEIVCLLGPNGGGKTTMLKTILGLLAPIGGEILVEGTSTAGWSRASLWASSTLPTVRTRTSAEANASSRSSHGLSRRKRPCWSWTSRPPASTSATRCECPAEVLTAATLREVYGVDVVVHEVRGGDGRLARTCVPSLTPPQR
jgi:ABC-type cobalamin/Fe3+-siderophores transport system ATPase subunit